MSGHTVSPATIVVEPPKLPDHIDPKGVVEAVKGFIPVTDFSPTKPYEDWKEYLRGWQQRLDSRIDHEKTFEKLEEERKKLEDKFREDLQRRIDDEKKRYDERTSELKDYHSEDRKSLEKNRADLEDHFRTLEARRDVFEAECKKALIDYYEKRLAELKEFHEEYKREIRDRIVDLESREKEVKEKNDFLERERDRHLDDRREWLRHREEKFDTEKADERKDFVALRAKVIQDEYGVEKTTGQILAEKFGWVGLVIFAVIVLLATGIIGFCLCRGIASSSKAITNDTPPNASSCTIQITTEPIKFKIENLPTTPSDKEGCK